VQKRFVPFVQECCNNQIITLLLSDKKKIEDFNRIYASYDRRFRRDFENEPANQRAFVEIEQCCHRELDRDRFCSSAYTTSGNRNVHVPICRHALRRGNLRCNSQVEVSRNDDRTQVAEETLLAWIRTRGFNEERTCSFRKCVPLRLQVAISHAAASDRRGFSASHSCFVAPRGQKEFYINKSLDK